MTSSYRTIVKSGQAEIEAKRSRFLCTLERVDDEAAARAVVERMRRQHWDARHHCSAFVVGPPPSPVERSSDDGEPAGTAGAPMLEVLRGHQLSDVVAVVTRWFGGTLLGAGGLVRAYGDAVRAALDVTGTLERRLLVELEIELAHADAGRVESELRSRDVAVLGTSYTASVVLRVGVEPGDEPRLHHLVAELTAGAARAVVTGERWIDHRS